VPSDTIQLPKFSLAERDLRYKTVRAEMERLGLDCLILPHNGGDWDSYQPDVRYLTSVGGGGSAAAAVFPLKGDPIAFCREGNRVAFWKRAQDWVSEIRAPKGVIWSRAIVEAVSELGYAKGRIGIIGLADVFREPEGTIGYGEFMGIQRGLPGATFENATDFMQRIRMCKTKEEIGVFEKAQACADAVSTALFETARVGVSELEIYAQMMAAHIRNGGEVPTMMLMSSGANAQGTYLLPTHRTLEKNDVMFITADTKYMGYQGQSVESICVGVPKEGYERCFEASLEIFNLIVDAMKPGVPYADLIRIWVDHAEKSGLKTEGAIGHGLGLGQDHPRAQKGTDGDGFIVEEGHTFVLKAGTLTPDKTISNRAGNVVVVEDGRARRLGKLEMKMRRL
jgi:Xaa-Pro dipeptidase